VNPPPSDRLQGTLDLLILRVLQQTRAHGWGIAQQIQLLSRDVLQVNQGSLYPALQRLEERGWIQAEWGVSENNRRARFYQMTTAGRRHFARELSSWDQFVLAVTRVLETA
jgi:transcriptional regulator